MRHLAVTAALVLWSSLVARADPGPTLPEEDARPGATRAQAVEAYVKDCHATLRATAWEWGEEKQVDECKALDVDQNCNPDLFGCAMTLDTCQKGCQPVCGKCQDTCAGGCDDCKAKCQEGDKACVRACAEARADCRERCVKGLELCRDSDCPRAESECSLAGMKKLAQCDAGVCDSYVSCLEEQEDYDRAHAICKPKAAGLSDFCLGVCDAAHYIPTAYLEDQAPPPAPETAKQLAAACTSASQCPSDYIKVAPYLASFCAGTTTDASLEGLAKEVTAKVISKRSLGLVFNAYGAIYGYEFKREKWMNDFFYGAGGAWLPASCRTKVKTVASAKVMSMRLTKLRDRVKRIWDAAP